MVQIGTVRDQVKKASEEKFKLISLAIPNEIVRRSQVLEDKIRQIYSKFKENPYSVAEYITFYKNFQKHKIEADELDNEMEALITYEELVYDYGIRIG